MLEQPRYLGSGLHGPECVYAEQNGDIWTTCSLGGLSHIRPDGTTRHVLASFANPGDAEPFEPNGFCRDQDGDFLIADMSGRRVVRMREDGRVIDSIRESQSGPLGQINSVHRDHLGRVWIVEQSRLATPDEALNPISRDGSILLLEPGRLPRVVASGLMHPNQLAVSSDGASMYVPQTTARNILEFPIGDSGKLGEARVFGPQDHGALIDGLALDDHGNVWGTHVGTDRVFRLTVTGEPEILLEDPDSVDGGAALFEAFMANRVDAQMIARAGGRIAPLTTSLAFCGEDRKTLLVGCLAGTRIASFSISVAGQFPAHWSSNSQEAEQ